MVGTELSRRAVFLTSLVLFCIIVLMSISYWSFVSGGISERVSTAKMAKISLVASFVISLSLVYLVREILVLVNKEKENEINKAFLAESRDLVDVLRANRHDYINHINVLSGLVQIGRTDLFVEYVKEVAGKLDDQQSIGRIKNVSAAALLLKKQGLAEEHGIKVAVEIETNLNNLDVPAMDINRILGNLIDNAVDAVRNLNNPEICVRLFEDNGGYVFAVTNAGLIPESIRSRIFEKGFTTKGAKGSGLGLYIVKGLAQKHGGHVEMNYNKSDVEFLVHLPASNKKT